VKFEEQIGLHDPQRWRSVLADMPHGWAHTWENCHAQHLTTGHSTYLYCARTTEAVVACPIAERRIDDHVDITTPSGFSGFVGTGEWPGFPEIFRQFARGRGYVCGYIALNPLFGDCSYIDEREKFPNTELYVLDLTLGIDVLHRRLSENRRRELRGWTPEPYELDRGRLTDFLLANYNQFMEQRGAGNQYRLHPNTLEAICAAPNVLMFGAESDGDVQVVRVIGYTPFGADDLFRVSTGDGSRHNTALTWCAVHRLIELGVPTYNLGGASQPGDAIAQAKKRFRPEQVTLTGIKQVYDVDAYELLCRRYGRNPSIQPGYFPPYRERDGGPAVPAT